MPVILEAVDYAEKYAQSKKRWLSPSELACLYGISTSSQSKFRMQSHSSSLPFSKIGKYIRYDRVAIDQWLEDHKIQG